MAERDDVYWAADDSETAVAGAIDRIKRYQEALSVSGRYDKMRRSWNAYKGNGPRGDSPGSAVTASGSNGEILNVNVNHFAELVDQQVTMITANKPAMMAIASNSDFESQAQADLCDAINEHYENALDLDDVEVQIVRNMALFGEAGEVLSWDATAGRKIEPPPPEPAAPFDPEAPPVEAAPPAVAKPQGEVDVMALTPLDYAYDPDARAVKDRTWVCFRRPVNKYDLAAKYPEKAAEIKASSDFTQANQLFGSSINGADFFATSQRRTACPESDVVFLWELRQLPTPACPNGRGILFTDLNCILFDTRTETVDETGTPIVADYGMPYKTLGITWVAPERLPGTDEGNTSSFDILSMQEGINLSASIMASAINAGGLQNLYLPSGANITAERLTGALNVIKYEGNQLPVAKDNISISPVVKEWIDANLTWMRQRVGSNDVASGETVKGMPAQLAAMLRATAVERLSGMMRAFEKLIQRSRTGIMKLLQQFATTERIALVAGKAEQWSVKYFKSEDIAAFDRFVIEPVNPVMKTLAGKVAFAQPLLDTGKISIEEYLGIVATGRLDRVLQGPRDNIARIQQEKELLMEGIGLPPMQMTTDPMTGMQVPVLDPNGLPVFAPGTPGERYVRPMVTDTHWIDIPEYLGVLAIPDIRSQPAVVKAVTGVVDLKLKMYRAMPPDLIMILGGPPPVQPPMPPAPGGAPGKPPTGGAGGPDVSGPKMPQPPKNPITQQQDLHNNIRPQ